MDAEVASLAIAELAAIPPAPWMDALAVIPPGRGADIHFPIQARWRRTRCGETSAAAVIAVNVHGRDLTQNAAIDVTVARFKNMRRAATLQADLHCALIFSRGGCHRLPFNDVVADRFLHIDISTRFAGFDHRQAMPMIRFADQDNFRTLLRQ